MRKLSISPVTRDNGYHVRIDGLGPSFRLRIGSSIPFQSRGSLTWLVDGNVGAYLLELLIYMIDKGLEREPQAKLNSYLSGEYASGRKGVTIDEKYLHGLMHPEGSPVCTWITRQPESAKSAEETISFPRKEEGQEEQKMHCKVITTFTAHAILLHSPDLILDFNIRGIESTWTEAELQWQVLRVAFSYFPLKNK